MRKPRTKKSPSESGESAATATLEPPKDVSISAATSEAEKMDTPQPPPTPTLEPEKAKIVETPVAETLPPVPPAPPVAVVAPAGPEFRYFKKISPNLPLYVDKVRVPFEVVNNLGLLRLPVSDYRMISSLEEMARAKRGGVVVIDEATYQGLKKNHPSRTFAPRSQQPKLRVWDSRPKSLSPSVSAPTGAAATSNSPVAGSSRGPVAPVGGDVPGAGKSPSTFTPNLQRRGAVMKTPASGQFRTDAGIPPKFPSKP